jgi:hypothetical protein
MMSGIEVARAAGQMAVDIFRFELFFFADRFVVVISQ